IGCIGLEPYPPCALLRSLVVQPAFRRHGVGNRLLAAAEDLARQLDVRALYLLTTDAAGFFAAHSYHTLGRETVPAPIANTAEFSRLCPTSAQCMAKALGRPG
ncbi:MAG TPA: GNAT family N-acetyltransferase, partial [Mariprofundaceae bacterium]|nr:GNAT family N-acetyltransferase [Mariprofundaceae bacterium]